MPPPMAPTASRATARHLFSAPSPSATLRRSVVLPLRSGRAESGTRAIRARAARIVAVPVIRRRMPRFFERDEEILSADDVEVDWEEGGGGVVWPLVLGHPGDEEEEDDEEVMDLVRRLILGLGVLSDEQFRQIVQIARRRVREDSMALQPLAAGGGDDGRGGTGMRVAVAAPAADDDDGAGLRLGRGMLFYYILLRGPDEEGRRRRGPGGGGRPPRDEDEDGPDLGPPAEPLLAIRGRADGEDEDGGAATRARVVLWVGLLAAVLTCVHGRRDD